jgi:hypothetical protein
MTQGSDHAENKRRRIPGIPDAWQQYGLCLLFHLFLPFLPLIIEYALHRRVEPKTSLLFLSVFPLSVGVSSRNRLMFGVTIVFGLIYSVFFGLISGGLPLDQSVSDIGYYCLAGIVITHALERYNRHVVDSEPFWEFG